MRPIHAPPVASEESAAIEILPAAFMGPPFARPPANEGITLVAAQRHWRFILVLTIVGGLSSYILCQMLTPFYASTATVMIDPREPMKPVSTDPNSALAPSEETVRKNEIALINSRQLAEAVVSDFRLDRDPEFNPSLRPPSALRTAIEDGTRFVSRLVQALGLSPEDLTKAARRPPHSALDKAIDLFLNRLSTNETDASRVINIRFLSENPERAARVANAVAVQYMHYRGKQDAAEAQTAITALRSEIEALNLKIRNSERAVEKMRNEGGTSPASDLKIIGEQMVEVNKELVAASAQRAAAQARLADLEAAQASNRLDSVASVLGSPLIQHLEEQAAQQAALIAEMKTLLGEQNPKVIKARAQLTRLRDQINTEIAKVAATYRADFAIAQGKEALVSRMIQSAKAETAKASAAEVDVRTAERTAEANRSLMVVLVARLNETEAQINRKGADAQLLSQGTVPQSPTFPPTFPVMAVVAFFCFSGGTIMSVWLERRDHSVRSMVQLREMSTVRVIGAVPAVKRGWQLRRSPAALVTAEPTSMFVENLRAFWFQISASTPKAAKTLVITSAVPGEGKTALATSLARLLALRGQRVVLIDADLRRPRVHRALGLKQRPGLADVIAGRLEINQVLQKDEASGAFFITAGAATGSPADYLQSEKMAQVLRILAVAFDAVIIDTPPLLMVHDAAIVARHSDTTVMVVRWGATRATTVLTALQRLHDLDIPVGGVVLSMVDRERYGQFGYPDGDAFSSRWYNYYTS